MKKTNKTAVIYARSATNEKSAIEMQIKSCQDYANKNGVEVKKVFIEKSSNREYIKHTSLQEAQEYLIENKVDYFLVHKFDRLSRNIDIALETEAFFAKNHIDLVAVSEIGIKPSVTGEFMKTILLSVAQLDMEMKSKRVKDAMTKRFKSGDWMWATPFGYTRTRSGVESEIKPKQDESELVRKIFSMAGEGASIEEIASQLYDFEGFPKDVMSRISIERIISNPFYKGYMKSSLVPELVKGNYSPLVTVSLWEQANNNIRN